MPTSPSSSPLSGLLDPTLLKAQALVDGQWTGNGQTFDVTDPATGSACANLGGYFWQLGHKPSETLQIAQGEHVGRPSLLSLCVDDAGHSHVGGHVIELGRGVMRLS